MAGKKKPETCAYFSIKNFHQFQHYKHRNPPWIRLYRTLLDDPEFVTLSEGTRFAYIGLTIVASMTNNKIKNDPQYLQMILNINHPPDLTPLFQSGFLLAYSYHDASDLRTNAPSEKSRVETEDIRISSEPDRASKTLARKRLWPQEFMLTEELRVYAEGRGIRDPADEFENFRCKALANNYRYVNWPMAWMAWCRNPLQQSPSRGNGKFQTNLDRLKANTQATWDELWGGPEDDDASRKPASLSGARKPRGDV